MALVHSRVQLPRATGTPWPCHASRALASGRLALSVGSGAVALVLAVVAARRFADILWPDLHVNPGLLAVAAGLSLLGYAFKAYGWERLFAADERPQPLALAAAMGGASSRRSHFPGDSTTSCESRSSAGSGLPGGREGARLSLSALGLVDAAALAPLL